MANLRCPFAVYHTESSTNYCSSCKSPAVPKVTTLSQLTQPVQNQSAPCGKEAEMITVHILTAHPVFIIPLQFRHKTNTKSFNIKDHTAAING